MPSQATREVMDIRECSEYLGISPDTLYRYAQDGTVPAFKLGNRWKFRRMLIDRWMDELAGIEDDTPVPSPDPKRR